MAYEHASLTLDGLEELRRELAALPTTWRAAAEEVVRGTAEEMARDVRAAYNQRWKEHTGNLTKDIRVEKVGPISYVVVNRARHAHLLEFGTVTRYRHDTGANRGRIDGRPVFIPLAVKYRRRMFERLKALLQSYGLTVTGAAYA
jgi:hypothetical protein